MATAIITSKTAAETTADITLSVGSTLYFSVIGDIGAGEFIVINKKRSDGTYRIISEERPDGKVIDGILSSEITGRGVTNSTGTAITLQIVKPATVAACGIDQD
jgi:hypothetical protein